jgi:hypothetical protein
MVCKCHHIPGRKYMRYVCNVTRRRGDRKGVILHQSAQGSVKALRVIRNTWVFVTKTSVGADVDTVDIPTLI